MSIESPRALVTFDPADSNADQFLVALQAKFGTRFLGAVSPGAVLVVLRSNAPDADALQILEESIGQSCPAQVGYPRLTR